MAGGEIRSKLSLDVTKFQEAIDRATSNLASLDSSLQTASKVSADFDKKLGGIASGIADTSKKFKLLDETIGSLVGRLGQVATVGFSSVSSSSKKAKKDIQEFSESAEKAGGAMLSISEWTRKYGRTIDSLKPSLNSARESQNELSASHAKAGKVASQSAVQQVEAKLKAVEAEKAGNLQIIESRRRLAQDLAAVEAKIRNEAIARRVEHDEQSKRYFGSNAGKISHLKTDADRLAGNADAIAKQIAGIDAVIAERSKLTASHDAEIAAIRRELAEAKEAAEVRRQAALAAAKAEIEAREREKEAAKNAARVKREEERAWRQYEKEQRKQAADEARAAAKAAKEVAREAAKVARDAERAASREAAVEARKLAAEKKELARQTKEAAKQAAREEADFNRWMKEEQKKWDREQAQAAKVAARERAEAEREVGRAATAAAREAAAAARQALAERKKAAKEAADYEREQVQSIAQMWKSMAQLWAASKIEHGLAGSVKAADDRARVEERYKTLNMGGEQGVRDSIFGANVVAKSSPNLSVTEAMKLYMAAQAGMARPDHEALNTMVPEIAKVLTVLQREFPEQAHNIENLGRNFMGVMESMGITHNTQKMTQALDVVYRALIATQGKMNEQDIETIMRRGGAGNAANKAIESIYWDVAMASQLKVMGGSGGGSGGVSTFATAEKMALKRVMGGTQEKKTALAEQIDFGLVDGEEILAANGGKVGKNYRPVAWKGANQAMDNPVPYLIQVAESIKKQLADGGAKAAPYIKGLDVKDDKQLSIAFGKWVDRNIGNTNVAEIMKAVAPHDTQQRLKEEVQASKNATPYGEAHKEALKSWGMGVKELDASMNDLGATVGTRLIGALRPLLDVMSSFLKVANDFAKDHPLATDFGIAATAATGLVMAFKGVTGTIGIASNLSTVMKAMAGNTTLAGNAAGVVALGMGGASAAATGATSAMAGFGQQAGRNAQIAVQAAMAKERMAEAARVTAIRELEAAQAAVASKTGFERLRAVQEQLIPAQQNAAKATAEHAEAHLAVGRAAQGASIATRALAGTLNLIGGPIGLITIALTAGLWAWEAWGKSAQSNASKAANAIDEATEAMKRYNEHKMFGMGEKATVKKAISASEADIADEQSMLDSGEVSSFGEGRIRARIAEKQEKLKKLRADLAQIEADEKAEKDKREKESKEAAERAGKEVAKTGKAKTGAEALATGDKAPRNFEDLFARNFYAADAKANIEQLKLESLVSGGASYQEQARQEVIKRWMGGDFDDGHDPAKRKFTGGKKYNPMDGWLPEDMKWDQKVRIGVGKDGKPVEKDLNDLADEIAKQHERADAVKAVAFAKEREGAASDEAADASKRLANQEGRETDALKALKREFSRAEKRNPGVADNPEYVAAKNKALLDRARADMSNYAADMAQRNREISASLLTKDGKLVENRERVRAEQDAAINAERLKMDAVRAAMDERMAAMRASNQQETDDYKAAVEERKKAETRFAEHLTLLERKKEEALMSPLQKMALEWHNVNDQIEQLESNWANGFIDNLNAALTGGKANWRGFLLGMANDVSKMMLKDTMGDAVKGMFGGVGNALKGAIGSGSGEAAGEGAMSSIGGMFSKASNAVSDFWKSITGATAATDSQTSAAGNLIEKGVLELTGIATKMSAEQAATLSLTNLAAAASAASVSMGGSGGVSGLGGLFGAALGALFGGDAAITDGSNWMPDSITGTESMFGDIAGGSAGAGYESALANAGLNLSSFANGGIMTEFGSVALRKYANGGVASGPQLALYGEGSMNEAYVPLPDGRSIPVTISGGNASTDSSGDQNINISIVVNQDGSESKSSSGSADTGAWSEMANRVKGVVREELAKQSLPGGVLYR